MVYRWVQLQGDGKTEALAHSQSQATATTRKMAPRHLAWLFLRDSAQLEKQEKQTLSLICKAQQIEIAYGLAQQFVMLLKERNAQPLEIWLRDCQMSGISDLVTFAASDWRKKVLLCTRHSPFPTVMDLLREKSTS